MNFPHAEKWYKRIGLPEKYATPFRAALQRAEELELPSEDAVKFLFANKDLGVNFVYLLDKLESTERNYAERGIPQVYLDATLEAVKNSLLYTEKFFHTFGSCDLLWLDRVESKDTIFRIGRLNFEIADSKNWSHIPGASDEDKVIAVHIPGGEPLVIADCLDALDEARRFFSEYFPEISPKLFVCNSWLLAPSYDSFLSSGSNIAKFRALFTLVSEDESDDGIRFIFSKAHTRENIRDFDCVSSLQKAVKEHIINGGKLYTGCGFISYQQK